ncbi:MAG TPA: acyltransferase [Polyangiales bacterium]
MPQDTTARNDHFVALDGSRGIGALLIVCGHALDETGRTEWVPHMQAGVDLFFALSGFVVGMAYQPRLEAGISFGDYAIRRLIRLWSLMPLAVAWGASTYLLKMLLHGQASPLSVLGSLMLNLSFLPSPLLQEYSGELGWAINVPLWSLSSEMFVSLLFGLVFWKVRSRTLLIWAALGAVGFALCALRAHDTNLGACLNELDATLVRPIYPFCIGLVMWRVTRGRRPVGRIPSSLVLGLSVVLLCVPRIAPKESALDLWFGLILAFVAMPAMLYMLAFMSRTSERSRRVLRLLGEASFPVYVLHFPLIMVVHFAAKRVGLLEQPALLLAIDVALAFALGLAAARFYDAPTRDWLTRLSKRRAALLALKRS